MKYVVNFVKEIFFMLKKGIGLCPYFSRSVVAHRRSGCFHNYFSNNGMFYLRKLLWDESLFENPLFHLLFKAFVFAEVRFIRNYIPQNSHEERLTGHLVSEIANSFNIISETFRQKAFELYGSEYNLEFYYADLSPNKNEKITGADLGIVFHINLPDYKEKINVAIIQAKKIRDKKGTEINTEQMDNLEEFAENFGYYCFYDMNTKENEQNSPLIQRASVIKSIIEIKGGKTLSIDDITQRYEIGIPLSIFLLRDMLDTESTNIRSFTNIYEVKDFIQRPLKNKKIIKYPPKVSNGEEFVRVNKVLFASIGGLANSRQEIKDISRIFTFDGVGEE